MLRGVLRLRYGAGASMERCSLTCLPVVALPAALPAGFLAGEPLAAASFFTGDAPALAAPLPVLDPSPLALLAPAPLLALTVSLVPLVAPLAAVPALLPAAAAVLAAAAGPSLAAGVAGPPLASGSALLDALPEALAVVLVLVLALSTLLMTAAAPATLSLVPLAPVVTHTHVQCELMYAKNTVRESVQQLKP